MDQKIWSVEWPFDFPDLIPLDFFFSFFSLGTTKNWSSTRINQEKFMSSKGNHIWMCKH